MYFDRQIQKRFLTFLTGMLRAYGGCLGYRKRRRTWFGCDKFRGDANQSLIRKCPNEETPPQVGDLRVKT